MLTLFFLRHTKSLSIILLTHATTSHLAAFAHCCKHIPLFTQIPVYATSPVVSLGRTLIQDLYSSTPRASTVIPDGTARQASVDDAQSAESPQILLPSPTADDIASYFTLINPLKYSQPHQPLPSPFSPPLNDLTITAYNAGHSLGGTIWHLQHGMESIVHAVDWNQLKENVYSGAAWLRGTGGTEVIEQLRKPTTLVCSAKGAERTALAGGRLKRDSLLIELIRSCVEKSGIVLIPTDTSARILELAYVLEHAWRKEASDPNSRSSLKSAKLYMASRSSGATVRHASSMLEWMEDNVVREFESESTNTGKQHRRGNSKSTLNSKGSHSNTNSSGPFDFRFLKKLQSRKRVESVLAGQGPRVILASDSSLEWGFSKHVLEKIVADPNNLVILTEDHGSYESSTGFGQTVRQGLWQCYDAGKSSMLEEIAPDGSILEFVTTHGKKLNFKNEQRAPLSNKEQDLYQQFLATQRQVDDYSQMENRTTLEASADVVDDVSSSSSSDEESDPERQGKALNSTFKSSRFNKTKTEPSKEALGVNVLLRYRGVYDYDVRDRKGRDQLFPVVNRRRRVDDFGELIKPEEYLRAEERDENEAIDPREFGKRDRETLGQKRKWQEMRFEGHSGGRNHTGLNKKREVGGQRRPGISAKEQEQVEAKGSDQESESSDESDAEHEQSEHGPFRLEVHRLSVEARSRIALVDFAGIHDQRSLLMLIPLIQPKKLILTAGTAAETDYLATECRRILSRVGQPDLDGKAENIFTPEVGQMISASVDTNAWTLKLSRALTRQLHWQNVRGLGVVTLAGQLAAKLLEVETEEGQESQARKKLKSEGMASQDGQPTEMADVEKPPISGDAPTLDILPPNMVAASTSFAQPLHVGDLRLADLRKILQSNNHMAEFRGEGTLLIDGLITVRKLATGKIELESGGLHVPDMRGRPVDGGFHAVKRKIYDGLAIIAGG